MNGEPILLSKDEVLSTVGVGPSEIATVLHESPWDDAYTLWARKTGRQEKPPQTDAMLFGIEKEDEAFEAYLRDTGQHAEQWQRQVGARHPRLEFLRGFADGWNVSENIGVDVKVPSSRHLLEEMVRGVVPRHYVLQMAAYMDMFGCDAWDFYVYDAAGKIGDLATLGMDEEFEPGATIRQFWEDTAVPALESFWAQIVLDEWSFDNRAEIDEAKWLALLAERDEAYVAKSVAEDRKSLAEAKIKRLLGRSQYYSGGGWKAAWTKFRPFNEVIVRVAPEALEKVAKLLDPLRGAPGVRDVKIRSLPEAYRFSVKRAGKES